MQTPPVVLTIAGSDSGGGAGIQADLKTFQALGCYGTAALTAVTAQNSRGVQAAEPITPDMVRAQLRSVLDDFPVRAAKTGMLFSREIIRAVRETIESYKSGENKSGAKVDSKIGSKIDFPLVIDPVSVATSGDRLLQEDALAELKAFLGAATLITPNLPEAEALLERKIQGYGEMEEAAIELAGRCRAAVLLKGGHLIEPDGFDPEALEVADAYCAGPDAPCEILKAPRIQTKNTHGTGCTLSAAITAGLGRGQGLREAVLEAKAYLVEGLRNSYAPGGGRGSVNHAWEK